MSPLLPNSGPPLKITHEPIPIEEMFRLRDALRAAASDGKITVELVEQVAKDTNAPRANVYAAIGTDPNFVVDIQNEILIAICIGTCQGQGAIENLEKLLAARSERLSNGKSTFDIIPRSCLDMCAHSPVALSRSPHGNAAHPKLTPRGVDELVEALCD